ncbi:MAG: tetratricopeptide repeat protein, partial [Novosphingobium sp.]
DNSSDSLDSRGVVYFRMGRFAEALADFDAALKLSSGVSGTMFMRALTLAKRQADAAGVAMALARPNAVMREILAISRYDKLFAVSDSIEAAI